MPHAAQHHTNSTAESGASQPVTVDANRARDGLILAIGMLNDRLNTGEAHEIEDVVNWIGAIHEMGKEVMYAAQEKTPVVHNLNGYGYRG